MIGQTISHYTIREKLGEGGMGVVYKARDTKLDRDVALKFLPRDVALSEDERARFIHEAKAASALEHPGICTIHEIGETSDGQLFIVMGYYEGESISRKVERGRVPVTEAVGIAIQVAEGLQAAHEKHIVHRDIKGGNIVVTERGQAKILDFGLARKGGLTKLTRTATTVGTAAYMSPEQARGEEVDERTDLWSLGVVLYEMVTGKLPFRGDHEAAILYSVVNEEPQPVEASVSDASLELIHIIRRALEKDASERYQTAADFLIDLHRLKKETSRTGFSPLRSGRPLRRRRKTLTMLAAVAAVTIAVVAAMMLTRRPAGINPGWKQHSIAIPVGGVGYPGISGDGNWIAFPARRTDESWGLYIMNANAGGPRLVDLTSSCYWVDVSPDGSYILTMEYNAEAGKTEGYLTNSNGGGRRRIVAGGCFGPRFRPDGKRIGYLLGVAGDIHSSKSGKLELWSVTIDGLTPKLEFTDSLSATTGSFSFSYSPDGRKVAWLRAYPEQYEEIIIHDLETGEERQITADRKHINEIAWPRQDQILFASDRQGAFNVWSVSTGGGAPVQVTNGVDAVGCVKSSLNGERVLYTRDRAVTDLWLVDLVANRARQITFVDAFQQNASFSPDGKFIACVEGGPYGPSHIVVMNRDGSNRRQLSFGDENVTWPIWSPDGNWIAYGTQRSSEPSDSMRCAVLRLYPPESPVYVGRGAARYWLDSTRLQIVADGRWYVVSIHGGAPAPVYDDSTLALYAPGGKHIIYQDLRKGKNPKAWWIVDGTQPREIQRATVRPLLWNSGDVMFCGDGSTIYSWRGVGEIWRMAIPAGKEERIRADLLKVEGFWYFSPNWTGKEAIIITPRNPLDVVMIENLFM